MGDFVIELLEWARANPAVLWWSGAISLGMFVGTLIVVPVLLVKLPADYFTTPVDARPGDWRGRHPVLRGSVRLGKNLLGLALVVLGIVLLVLPGQGLLTILLGITLVDFPGKRRLENALVRRRGVGRAVNWLRAKYGRPPLQIPPKAGVEA